MLGENSGSPTRDVRRDNELESRDVFRIDRSGSTTREVRRDEDSNSRDKRRADESRRVEELFSKEREERRAEEPGSAPREARRPDDDVDEEGVYERLAEWFGLEGVEQNVDPGAGLELKSLGTEASWIHRHS